MKNEINSIGLEIVCKRLPLEPGHWEITRPELGITTTLKLRPPTILKKQLLSALFASMFREWHDQH